MIRTTKRELYLYVGMFLIIYPIFFVSLAKYLMPGALAHLFPILGAAFVFAYKNNGTIIQCRKQIAVLLAAAFGFIYIGARKSYNLDDFHFLYLALLVCMLLLHLDVKWYEIFWNWVRIFAVFHLVTGILLLLNRDFQLNYIVPLFEIRDSTRKALIHVIGQGYMTGLNNHYTFMGNYMVLGVVAFAKPLFTANGRAKYIEWIMFLAMLAGLIMTAKRGPFLFAVVAIAFVYWQTNRPFTVRQYRQTLLLLFGIAIIVPVAYMTIPQFEALVLRFMSNTEDFNALSNNRVALLWLPALQFFSEKPIFGNGWRSFRVMNAQRYGMTNNNDVHNIYLQLAAETGIVGLSVFLLLFIGAFALTLRALKLQKKWNILTQQQTISLKLALTYQLYFILYGFTENPLYASYCYVPYFLCCTIGYSAWYKLNSSLSQEQQELRRLKFVFKR